MRKGIDVSSYQGDIRWPLVKAAGTEFVMLRVGWSWYEGGMSTDKKFLPYLEEVKAEELPWGVYLYAYDKTPEAAVISARILAKALKGQKIPYPVAYDFEDAQYLSKSKEENTAIALSFLGELRAQGFYGMLYTYAAFAATNLDMSQLKDFEYWVADYRKGMDYAGLCGMWQYTATGSVSGIVGNVDQDYCYKDYAAIIPKTGLNGYTEGNEELRAEVERLQKELEELRRRCAQKQQSCQAALNEIIDDAEDELKNQ